MSKGKKRLAVIATATIFAVACGALAGYYLARQIAAFLAVRQLDEYAGQLVAEREAASAELRTILTAMEASRYRSCSSAELGYFRALIFESEYLQDAGRIQAGRIECAAALNSAFYPRTQIQPDITQQDGTVVYKDLAPYQRNGLTAIALQRGNFYVVFTPLTRMHIAPPPMHYTETATDSPTQTRMHLLGEPLQASLPILSGEGSNWQGENLYATRCSIRFFDCITTFTTMSEIVAANHVRFLGGIVLFGLGGGIIGLVGTLLYRRTKCMEQQLRRAIRQSRLNVVYQPQVDLRTGSIIGAEALVRWTDENGIIVSPDVFVRVAERKGFVGEITKFVVLRVLKDFGAILRERSDFHISVNITAADLADSQFLINLEQSLNRAGVAAQSMTLEITESSTVQNAVATNAIHCLRQRGHAVHIDDFGTGYSSLSYLQNLAVDAIKIDKSFTQSIGTGSVTVTLLPQILAIAEALNLQVIVEGVETMDQAAYFSAAPTPIFVQGWLFGRPMPVDDLHRILEENAETACAIPNAEVVKVPTTRNILLTA